MRIDGVWGAVAESVGVVRTALVVTLLTLAVGTVHAQAPLAVNADTRVGALRFSFADTRSFSVDRLKGRLALRAPGRLEFLPLYTTGPFPFSPLELQRDVARLRLFYKRSGFPAPRIEYAVTRDEDANTVDVGFLVTEGDPITRGELIAADSEGVDIVQHLPDSLRAPWSEYLETVRPARGDRLGDLERTELADRVSGWLRDRGYPFATASTGEADSSAVSGPVDVALVVQPGVRARIGAIEVEGVRRLTAQHVVRELPYEIGDWYSAELLAEGERELFALDLIRVALSDPERVPSSDSTVTVRVRIEENLPRVISGQLGYATESGVIGQADFTHRTLLGGARTLSASLQGRTGGLVIGPNFQRRYSASMSFKQPYFYGRTRSLVLTPQVEYRDDFRDRSVQAGAEAVVVQQWGVLRTLSVHIGGSRRRVLDFRPTGTDFDFANVLIGLDTLDHDIRLATLGGSLSWGDVDNPIAPRSGYLFRASAEVTGPPFTTSAQYARLEASFARFLPFTPKTGLVVRLSTGRMWPFGNSIPEPGSTSTSSLLRLRDAMFTAGGRYDVRGWGEQQLGPKFPDVRIESTVPDTVLLAKRYVPLGGLARSTVSLEMRLPLPGASAVHSTHVFVDSGQIWTPDPRFRTVGLEQDRWRAAVGAGVELATPVGLVRLSGGYKLNPSDYDVRDPQDVFTALVAGTPISAVPTEGLRRWHVHIAIGQVY